MSSFKGALEVILIYAGFKRSKFGLLRDHGCETKIQRFVTVAAAQAGPLGSVIGMTIGGPDNAHYRFVLLKHDAKGILIPAAHMLMPRKPSGTIRDSSLHGFFPLLTLLSFGRT